MRNVPVMSLAEVSELVQYGYTASATDTEIGPKFLRITDIVPPQIDWNKVPYCEIDENNLAKFSLAQGDIVIARTGATVGYAKLIRNHEPSVFASYLVRFRVDPKKADPGYVGRIVESDVYKRFILSRIGGAAQPNANANVLSSFRLPIPERHIQIRIASILSAYDDLIENNRRRIQLLEQSARMLYKEWFVHLRFPGHESVKIKDGVPEGWEYKQVKDILRRVKRPRKIKKEYFLADGLIPCIDQSQDFIGGYTDDEEALVDIGQPVIVFGDHTRILKFIDFPFACGADGTQLIVANDKAISQEFLYFALDAIDLSDYFYARHFKFLKDQHLPCPIEALIAQFTDHVRPIMQQIKSLRSYSHHLTQSRDLLLPRLMNGQVAA